MPEEMEASRRLLYGAVAACFFIAGLILIVFLFLVGIPGGNRTGIMDFCRVVFKPGHRKRAHIRRLECREDSPEKDGQEERAELMAGAREISLYGGSTRTSGERLIMRSAT